jgi:tetratricopeptide (TPR) repeat protein
MNDENPARPARRRFLGPLLFLSLLALNARMLLSAQEGQEPPAATKPQAAETSPKPHPLSFEDRADIFMARKSYGDAVDYYYRALKQANFKNAMVWNKLGIAYQQIPDYHAARKAYSQAIRLQKNYSEPLNNLGTTYFLQGKYGKSVKYYLRALKLEPNTASYHLNLGTSYFHMKKSDEFMEEYMKALSLDPNIFTARSAFGTVLQARGTDPEYYFYMAKIYAHQGRIEEAVHNLRRALEDGFKDRKRILNDPDLMKISQNPAYVELMKNPPVAIKD